MHELDGIDQPVDPHQLLTTGSALWGTWLDYRPGVVPEVLIGMGTGGIVPAIAVAIASGLPYLLTAGRVRGKRVLLVGGHVSHECSLDGFVSKLRDEAANVVGMLCLTEDAAGAGRRRVESAGLALCAVRMR